MDTDVTTRERLIEACDFEPIPADVLDRIRLRVQLAHASRYALTAAFEQSI